MRCYIVPVLAILFSMSWADAGVARNARRHAHAPHHQTQPHHPHHASPSAPHPLTGMASWYGLHDGSTRRTASGRPFNPYELGVAHRSWPFGTRLRVTVVETGRSVVVTVLDRTGPAVAANGRTFDLYYGAARALGIIGPNVALVHAEPVGEEEVAEAPEPSARRLPAPHGGRRKRR